MDIFKQEYELLESELKASQKSVIGTDQTIQKMITFFKYITDRYSTQLTVLSRNAYNINLYYQEYLGEMIFEMEILLLENFYVQQFLNNPQLFLHVDKEFELAAWKSVSGTFKSRPEFPQFNEIFIAGHPVTFEERLDFLRSVKLPGKNVLFVELNAAFWKNAVTILTRLDVTFLKKARLIAMIDTFDILFPSPLINYSILDPIKWSKKRPVFFFGIFLYGIILDSIGVKFK